jgi:hypothetical protein
VLISFAAARSGYAQTAVATPSVVLGTLGEALAVYLPDLVSLSEKGQVHSRYQWITLGVKNMFTERLDVTGYEEVYRFTDTDFSAFIAIHNTQLGPALGGCRIKPYESDNQALQDVLLLAKGMTLKNSLAGLNYGGGKMVVNAPDPTRDRMHLVGAAVETL